ncbi:hypothetical protein E1287_00935 [Actinomadura sp. KC06]|uniref:hypothetical protein n=1 Tax=Actinomadura sp. KC06 TaxID=2530369 RepID=UPI00104D537C|nr:hypothetical protein [Actinomadura sp. KC06]TDD40568.1 hypothetical protein E1287_00935 [Actinomadura sp. KC06]
MNSKKERFALIASLIGVFVLLASCVASMGDGSSGDGVSAVTTPTASPSSWPEPLVYAVTSVKGKRVDGDNCVIAQVVVTNNRVTTLGFGPHHSFPTPFSLVNAKGKKVRSVVKSLTVDGRILPGDEGTGSISFCAAGIASGSRVVLHHGKKKWKVGIPKPKPKPKPKRPVKAPNPPSRSDGSGNGGGGGYPGYTGPRCYAPGGKTWRPC